jgi:hypothetical protein
METKVPEWTCGKCELRRKSRYCPECGQKAEEVRPLYALLEHCEYQAKNRARDVRRYGDLARGDDEGDPGGVYAGREEHAKEIHAKWLLWASELKALLSKGGES